MQVQKLRNYYQNSTNQNKKANSKDSISFGMECKPLDTKSRKVIFDFAKEKGSEIIDLIENTTTPESFKDAFSKELKGNSNPEEMINNYNNSEIDFQFRKQEHNLNILITDDYGSPQATSVRDSISVDKLKETIKNLLNNYIGERALDKKTFFRGFSKKDKAIERQISDLNAEADYGKFSD
jgi:hypothetical protein